MRTTVAPATRLLPGRPYSPLLVINGLGLIALLVVLFTLQPSGQTMKAGAVADETVVAQHKVAYVNHTATSARKRQAMDGVQPVYVSDTDLAVKHQQEASRFFAAAAPIIASAAPPSEKLTAVDKVLPPDVPSTSLQQFASLSPADLQVVRDRSLTLLSEAIAWHFDSNEKTATELVLLSTVSSKVSVLQRAAIGEILSTFLAATMVPDNTATNKLRKQAAAKVVPVISTIYSGEVVVRRGDIVTSATMEKLDALGLQNRQSGWQEILASLLFAGIIVITLFWYLQAFSPAAIANRRLLLLIDASVLLAVIGTQLLAPNHILLPFVLPVAAGPTFAAVLIAPEACIALGLAMALLAGWVTANSFELTIYYFLTAAAGVLAIRQVKQLKQFILAGVYIGVFGLVAILSFALVTHNDDFPALQEFVAAAALNGLISASLALGGFALLSQYFGVTTTLHLLELGQPNQPLLRRLMSRAPGTYNHSVLIASMVEHAAEEIGADSLVARAGALYHDVGKSANPHCFVENQLGRGNIHDELRPEESARLIRGHVSQGLRLAKQYKLPRVVLDAIVEHHGTMRIAYFLHRAQEYGDGPVDLSLYTYPGPRPQSKETALLMLADGCESAVRSTSDHSPEKIREIVDRIFRERIDQGQLSECPMTLRDLELARDAFLAVLNGLYHPRIEYPEPIELQVEVREDYSGSR